MVELHSAADTAVGLGVAAGPSSMWYSCTGEVPPASLGLCEYSPQLPATREHSDLIPHDSEFVIFLVLTSNQK